MSSPLWIFGYGSLLWDPGFTPAEQCRARLEGWHRSFSMRSIHYRGTVQDPGLVLALDQRAGAACDGIAMRVEQAQEDEVLAMLRARTHLRCLSGTTPACALRGWAADRGGGLCD